MSRRNRLGQKSPGLLRILAGRRVQVDGQNDIIDAHTLVCRPPNGQWPMVGITAYAGKGATGTTPRPASQGRATTLAGRLGQREHDSGPRAQRPHLLAGRRGLSTVDVITGVLPVSTRRPGNTGATQTFRQVKRRTTALYGEAHGRHHHRDDFGGGKNKRRDFGYWRYQPKGPQTAGPPDTDKR